MSKHQGVAEECEKGFDHNLLFSMMKFIDDGPSKVKSDAGFTALAVAKSQLFGDEAVFGEIPSASNMNFSGTTAGNMKRRPMIPHCLKQLHFAKLIDETKLVPKSKIESSLEILSRYIVYMFKLFQEHALLTLQAKDSLLVVGHAGIGKTNIGMCAISLCLANNLKAIFVSPTKAMCRKKYNRMLLEYKDKGLLTADTQINPEATFLFTTPDQMRNMLYDGDCTKRFQKVGCVVFDDVHLINDEACGYMLEELLIVMPPYIQIVLLSDIIPNGMELADWLGSMKSRKINVIQKMERPISVAHYLYVDGGGVELSQLFPLININDEFMTHNYKKAVYAHKKCAAELHEASLDGNHPISVKTSDFYVRMLKTISSNNLMPSMIITFEPKRCDEIANALLSKAVDYTTVNDKKHIQAVLSDLENKLPVEDRCSTQWLLANMYWPLGMAVHHADVPSAIKDAAERLFRSESLKVLVATKKSVFDSDLFAPTVVIDSIKVDDPNGGRRFLSATEYLQLSDRSVKFNAKNDDHGAVIIVPGKEGVPELLGLTNMLMGKLKNLELRFRKMY